MERTIYHVTGSPDGNSKAGGKAVSIVHLKLGKITRRSDGRYQAGYRDIDRKAKFITCNSEEEVLERFQALQLTQEKEPKPEKKPGRSKAATEKKAVMTNSSPKPLPRMTISPLADYMLNWLEKYNKGKIRPSSYERYQFLPPAPLQGRAGPYGRQGDPAGRRTDVYHPTGRHERVPLSKSRSCC